MISADNPLAVWLLQSQIPTIRYLTITRLLGKNHSDPTAQKEFQRIQKEGAVPAILARQIAPGQWPYVNHYYTPKYVSTHWSMLLLRELLVDPHNPRYQDGIEYMLSSTSSSIQESLPQVGPDLVCLWANILAYAVYGNRIGDDRLVAIIEVCAKSVRDTSCRCKHNLNLPCSWGVVRALWAFAAIPETQRSQEIKDAVDHGINFLLEQFDLTQANYPSPENKIHPIWFKLSFPLFYQSDILMTLRVLGDLNQLHHPGAQAALDWLEGKRAKNRQWRGSSPFRQRTWPELADQEEINRWVSFYAAWILNQAGREIE